MAVCLFKIGALPITVTSSGIDTPICLPLLFTIVILLGIPRTGLLNKGITAGKFTLYIKLSLVGGLIVSLIEKTFIVCVGLEGVGTGTGTGTGTGVGTGTGEGVGMGTGVGIGGGRKGEGTSGGTGMSGGIGNGMGFIANRLLLLIASTITLIIIIKVMIIRIIRILA